MTRTFCTRLALGFALFAPSALVGCGEEATKPADTAPTTPATSTPAPPDTKVPSPEAPK